VEESSNARRHRSVQDVPRAFHVNAIEVVQIPVERIDQRSAVIYVRAAVHGGGYSPRIRHIAMSDFNAQCLEFFSCVTALSHQHANPISAVQKQSGDRAPDQPGTPRDKGQLARGSGE
jgi:hypothetical protein